MQQERAYQRDAVEAVFGQWTKVRRTLGVAPTGSGKTNIACEIIRRMLPARTIFLAHRVELVRQAVERLASFGIDAEIEQGNSIAGESLWNRKPVVVATPQTLFARDGRRLKRFDASEFGCLIIDETHHYVAESFRKPLDHFCANENLKVLGLTATADRADGLALSQIMDSVAFNIEICSLIDDGWLVPIQQQMVKIEGLDFSQCHVLAGELNGADLDRVMREEKTLLGVASASIEIVGSKRAVVFCVSVKQAERLAEIFNRHRPDCADWLHAGTPADLRKEKLAKFGNGTTQIMVNVGVLCLDSETEILTSNGWVGCDDMTYNHLVANWDNGRVFFDNPKHIVRRERKAGERMVVLETKNRSIRVTEDHRMLYRTNERCNWKIKHASELVGERANLPISGMAEPLAVSMPVPKRSMRLRCKRVAANAYMLRNNNGFEWEQSVAEAERRIDERDSLNFKHPSCLTLEECEFIGFWLGDGGVCQLQRGGVEYTLCQFVDCPAIIDRVDQLISACGFDAIKRTKPSRGKQNVVVWSLPRGTGFGTQKRNGVFPIEPYLNKQGSDLLWGFNESQFDALLYGYWMADGEHRNNIRPLKGLIRICGARSQLFSTLQAIACVRGYRVSLIKRPNGKHWLWFLSLTKKTDHRMTKFPMMFEEGWKPEQVWCVTSTTGNIITRRSGTVTVLGNTEGYDNPGIEVVVQARPTMSRSLYAQMVGRGMRSLTGVLHDGLTSAEERKAAIAASLKPHLTVLDFAGNSGRFKLVTTADILGGRVSEEAKDRAIKILKATGKAANITEAMREAEAQIRIELEEAKKRAAAERRHIIPRAEFNATYIDPFDAIHRNAERWRSFKQRTPLTSKQRHAIIRCGADPDTMTVEEGVKFLSEKFGISEPQRRLLLKGGYKAEELDGIKKWEAAKLIDAMINNNWRRPPSQTQQRAKSVHYGGI